MHQRAGTNILFILLITTIGATASGRLLSAQIGSRGQSGGGCTLIVHITGVRNHKGVVGGAVFRSSDGWPENESKAFAHGPFPIVGSTATLTFPRLPAGPYSVVVLHDENGNQKLDRNFLGVPKEGFGFANNPKVWLSPPAFDRASVKVACPVTETTVGLIYK